MPADAGLGKPGKAVATYMSRKCLTQWDVVISFVLRLKDNLRLVRRQLAPVFDESPFESSSNVLTTVVENI
jgi:hypothetical protein